jgi:uncharacterized protein YukE
MSGFRSDTGQLAQRAEEFDELAGQAERLTRALRQSAESAGQCWGTDAIGQSFAATHQQRAQQTLDELGELPGRLRDMGAKFAETASNQRHVDAANADMLGVHAEQG